MKSRVRGSVLLLSVVLSLLVITLMLYLLPLNSFMFKSYVKSLNEQQVYSSIRSVLLIHLHSKEVNAPVDPASYREFESTTVQQEQWGLFEVVSLTSSKGEFTKEKSYLLGQDFHYSTDSLALTVPQINSSVFCVGRSTIEGSVILPKEGIKTGYIDGKIYSGSLKEMEVIVSNYPSLPEVGGFYRSATDDYHSVQKLAEMYKTDISSPQGLTDSVYAPFSGSTMLFHSNSPIMISRAKVGGKVIVSSGSSITVEGQAEVNDAILIAPIVKINQGFSGNLQVFATDTVVLGEGVELVYPSAIYMKQVRQDRPSMLEIKSKATVDGAIIVTRPSEVVRYYYYPRVKIDELAKVRGVVYVQGLTDLRGTVQGATLTDHFYCQTPSGFYLNHLYNGSIIYNNMPYEYGIPFLYTNKWKKCLIKELN